MAFALNISYFYLRESACEIRIWIHKVVQFGSLSATLVRTIVAASYLEGFLVIASEHPPLIHSFSGHDSVQYLADKQTNI